MCVCVAGILCVISRVCVCGVGGVWNVHLCIVVAVTRTTFRRTRAASNCNGCPSEHILEKQENKYGDTCCAGAVRPRSALFAWRIRESCTRHVVTKTFAAQTWRIGWVNRAHGTDLGEDAARGPVTCCVLISSLWAVSQTISSCFS